MEYYLCPLCRQELKKVGNSCYCPDKHCYDLSKKGVINLLRSQKSNHGDDKIMVNARRSFLDKGYYLPLLEAIQEQLKNICKNNCVILDCGCGECWYTAGIYNYLSDCGIKADIYGIDVSKEAVSAGAVRCKELKLAVASVYDIPLPDESCDIIISLFAPFSPKEYLRLLKKNGIFLTAFPMEEHLWELKQAVYEKPYKNEVGKMEIDGFELIDSRTVHKIINLSSNDDITSLFSMTPYYYKTSRSDKEKLNSLENLDTQIHFCSAVYKKL